MLQRISLSLSVPKGSTRKERAGEGQKRDQSKVINNPKGSYRSSPSTLLTHPANLQCKLLNQKGNQKLNFNSFCLFPPLTKRLISSKTPEGWATGEAENKTGLHTFELAFFIFFKSSVVIIQQQALNLQ